jgi:hypothetical protein
MTQDDAYAAGIIDGEGSIGVTYRTTNDSYLLVVQVSMTQPAVPTWLHETYGGGLGMYAQGARSWGSQYVYKWSIYGKEALLFISKVIPYLKEKRLQAEVASDYPVGREPGLGRKLSPEDRATQADMYELLRSLKTK